MEDEESLSQLSDRRISGQSTGATFERGTNAFLSSMLLYHTILNTMTSLCLCGPALSQF